MKKNNELEIVFLLDRSGSMAGAVEDTIGGFNDYIKKQKNNKNTYVTTILFDDQYEVLHDRLSIEKVGKLTNKEYYVRGTTALLDAIGKTIVKMDKVAKDKKCIFIITTDGLENASIEFSKKDINKLIKNHNNWEFMYIGADIDSYAEGRSLGISDKNIANYRKDKKGISKLYSSVGKATAMYREDTLCESWKEELDEYIKENE